MPTNVPAAGTKSRVWHTGTGARRGKAGLLWEKQEAIASHVELTETGFWGKANVYPYISAVAGGALRKEPHGIQSSLWSGLSLKDTAEHGQGLHIMELAVMRHPGKEEKMVCLLCTTDSCFILDSGGDIVKLGSSTTPPAAFRILKALVTLTPTPKPSFQAHPCINKANTCGKKQKEKGNVSTMLNVAANIRFST